MARVFGDSEVMARIETEPLYGVCISWVDAHLLASALLETVKIWTWDKRLVRLLEKLGLAFVQAK